MDFFSQVSDRTRMSVTVDLTQILTRSSFGNRLLTFRCITPSPDLDLKSIGVLKQFISGLGLSSILPDNKSKRKIKHFFLTGCVGTG